MVHCPAGKGTTSISSASRPQFIHDNQPVPSVLKGTAGACLAFLLAGSACTSGGQPATPIKTITIGVDLPLTGPERLAGVTTLNGINFFVHSHQVLDGFTIVVDARDDAAGASPGTSSALQNVNAFISNSHVLAMIGPLDSNLARAEIPAANPAHLAMVSPTTSSRCLTKEPFLPIALNPLRTAITCKAAGLPAPADLRPTGLNNYFRLSTTDDLQGPAAADYASRSLHLLRMAVFSDREAYGQGLANSFASRFNKLGGSIVDRRELDPFNTADVTAFLQRARRDGAQGLYYGGTSSNGGCSVRSQMAGVFEAGDAAPFLGGDGIALDPACVHDAGTNFTGIYATVPAIDAERLNSAKPVLQAFKSDYGRPRDFGPFTLAAYDAAGVVYDALDRAIKAAGGNIPFRDDIVMQLASTTRFQGATGTFGFDSAGDTTLRVVSIFRPAASKPMTTWTWVDSVDYSVALPY
jgi:branched-chain amino acid transport system substrate-binding protein